MTNQQATRHKDVPPPPDMPDLRTLTPAQLHARGYEVCPDCKRVACADGAHCPRCGCLGVSVIQGEAKKC